MRNVLVVAYYFPPMGLSGIQRTLKFVKYLADFGWQPTVLTVAPHAYFAFDDTFLKELQGRHVEIWRTPPGRLFSLLKKRRTVSLEHERFRKVLNRISQMIFLPDNKIGWKRQVLQALAAKDLSGFDAVIATAPPFTDHLIGAEIKRRYGLPLLLDFRDAWIEFPYHRYVTRWHRSRHEELEAEVVDAADAIVTTNGYVRDLLVGRHGKAVADRISVITQGFDPQDFEDSVDSPGVDPTETNFVYTGIFYEDRDPLILYRALASIRASNPEAYNLMRFYMVGYVQEEYRQSAESMGIADRFVYTGYVNHPVAISLLQKGDVAWFNIGARDQGFETVSPGKVFEYLGSGKPIVAMVPENDIRTILRGFSHTFVLDPDDQKGLERTLVELVARKRAGTLPVPDRSMIDRYSRKALTGDLARLLDSIARNR